MLIFQTPSERQSPAMRRSSLPTAGAGDSNANALSRLSTRPRWLGGEFFGGQLLGTCLHRAHEEQRNKDHTKTSRDTPAARSVTATISCARRLLPHGPSGAPLTVAADAAKRGASAARIGTGATIRFDAWPTSLVCCCAVCGLSPCYHSQHGLNSGAVYRLVTIRRALSIHFSISEEPKRPAPRRCRCPTVCASRQVTPDLTAGARPSGRQRPYLIRRQ